MAQAMKIAIVDDEQDMRQSISQWLALSGFDTETFASAEDALKGLGTDYPGVVVSDIKMPGMDGMQFLKRLMSVDSALPVIMITGHGDVPMAVEAMRVGAFDFLEKPFNPDRMTELAKKATNSRRLTLDNRALRRELSDGTQLIKKLIGASPVMASCRSGRTSGSAFSWIVNDADVCCTKSVSRPSPAECRDNHLSTACVISTRPGPDVATLISSVNCCISPW